MSDIEMKNAIIEEAILDIVDRGFLTASIQLNYGDSSFQHFGNYALYLPKSYTHHKQNSVAGHFIFRVMEIADVGQWDKLVGKSIRVKSTYDKVLSIGHIIKDDWFTPSEDFKAKP